jgi:hypothetical protein
MAALVAVLVLGLAACGPSGSPAAGSSASPTGSGGVSAYINCLNQHRGSGGARKACKSLIPAGGLGSVLRAFTNCLQSHGVTLPAASPGASSGGILKSIRQLKSGTSAQQSAYNACTSSLP